MIVLTEELKIKKLNEFEMESKGLKAKSTIHVQK